MLKHCVQLKTGHQRPVLELLGTWDIVPENGTVPFKTGLLVTLLALSMLLRLHFHVIKRNRRLDTKNRAAANRG
jgi:hypothetical protein